MATIQNINVGTTTNDGTGDTLRNAFIKTNDNFTSVNSDLALKATLASPTITGTLTTVNDAAINSIKIGRGAGNIATNTVVGNLGLNVNSSGYQNVSIGNQSLFSNVNGYYNTGIGVISLSNNVGFANCTGIGYDSQITADNQVQLGNASTTPYAYQALSLRSDLRDKTEVRDTVLGLDFVNSLRAVDYKWDMREDYKTEMPTQGELSDEDFKIVMDEWLESVKLNNITHDGTHTRTRYHHGLIAQEVQDVIQASGVDFGGFQDHSVNGGQDVLSIGYTELIAPMIKAIQELTARINVLEGN